MSEVSTWSTTAAENNATPPDGWPEGMPPNAVNDSARENMAAHRRRWNDAEWFQYGDGSAAYTATYVSGTSFTIAGADVSAHYHIGRRVRVVAPTPGTLYGTITAVSYVNPDTTVTVAWDSGSLSNEAITSVATSIISKVNSSIPASENFYADAGGTADAITMTLTTPPTAYAAGQVFQFKATGANTVAPTLNVNGLGAVAIHKRGEAIGAGEIQADDIVTCVYDGTVMQMTSVGRDSFPTGGRMLWGNASAPLGWTKETTFNQHALRITSGTGGATGGSVDFTTAFSTSRGVGGSSSSASPGVASHSHQQRRWSAGGSGQIKIEVSNEPHQSAVTTSMPTTSNAGGGSSHTHGSNYSVNVGVRYLDMITIVKN